MSDTLVSGNGQHGAPGGPWMSASGKRRVCVLFYAVMALVWFTVSLRYGLSCVILDVIGIPWAPLLVVWSFGGVWWMIVGAAVLVLLYWTLLEGAVWLVMRLIAEVLKRK